MFKQIEKEINSISSYLFIINEIKKNKKYIFFRGQEKGYDNGWILQPKFFREKTFKNLSKELEYEEILKIYEKNINFFENIEANNLVGILSILQHYGFPTRMLDITINPLIALYFAIENYKETEDSIPVVYLICATYIKSAYTSNVAIKEFYNSTNKNQNKIQIVNGPNISDRIFSQKGDFVFFYEEIDLKNLAENNDLDCFELKIDTKCIKNISNELQLVGITKKHMYPSLEQNIKEYIDQIKTLDQINTLDEIFNKQVKCISNLDVGFNKDILEKIDDLSEVDTLDNLNLEIPSAKIISDSFKNIEALKLSIPTSDTLQESLLNITNLNLEIPSAKNIQNSFKNIEALKLSIPTSEDINKSINKFKNIKLYVSEEDE